MLFDYFQNYFVNNNNQNHSLQFAYNINIINYNGIIKI